MANTRIWGYAQRGGNTVTTQGLISTTKVEQSFPTCTITVFDAGTTNLSTIYSDSIGTPKSNPFLAAIDGLWFFYVPMGNSYDVRFSGTGFSTFTLSDLIAPGTTGGGGFTPPVTTPSTGQILSNLEHALENVGGSNATQFSKFALQKGTSGITASSESPIVNYQIHQRPNAAVGQTLFNYAFGAQRHGSSSVNDGNAGAVYNLAGYIYSDATLPTDVVATAGLVFITAGGAGGFGLYGDVSNQSPTARGVACELDIRNQTGTTALDTETGLDPLQLGLSVVGRTAGGPAGSLKNSAALLVDSVDGQNSAFLVGLRFRANSIDTNGFAIDTNFLGSSIKAMRLANGAGAGLYGRNALNNANIALLAFNSANQIQLGAGLKLGAGSFDPLNPGIPLLYTFDGTAMGIVAGTGNNNDLLIASRDGTTIMANPANSHNWIMAPGAYIYQGAPNAAPVDGSIPTGSITFYLDEVGNNIKVRVKYSTGLTFKTGTLAIV